MRCREERGGDDGILAAQLTDSAASGSAEVQLACSSWALPVFKRLALDPAAATSSVVLPPKQVRGCLQRAMILQSPSAHHYVCWQPRTWMGMHITLHTAALCRVASCCRTSLRWRHQQQAELHHSSSSSSSPSCWGQTTQSNSCSCGAAQVMAPQVIALQPTT